MARSTHSVFKALSIPILFVAIIWMVHIIHVLSGISFTRLGVFPRELNGTLGILTSPLVHSSWKHLVSNSAPLIITSSMIWLSYPSIKWKSFISIYFLAGIGLWIFGRGNYHIGASGVVYGLVSFLFFNGIFRGNTKSFVIALIIMFMYGGMIYGLLPGEPGVSWEGHLTGLIAGSIISFVFRNQLEPDEIPVEPDWVHSEENKKYFLPRDTFQKTKQQRYQEYLDGQRDQHLSE